MLPHNKNIGYYISVIYRHMQAHMNKKLNVLDIGSGQYLYFIRIAKNEGISQKELSQGLAIDKGTTAKAVAKLIKQEYVFSKTNESDQRCGELYLTEKGKEIFPQLQQILMETADILRSGMDEKEETAALASLEKIAENITQQTHQNCKGG